MGYVMHKTIHEDLTVHNGVEIENVFFRLQRNLWRSIRAHELKFAGFGPYSLLFSD